MKNSKFYFWSFINALGAFIYTAAVAWLLFNGQKFFGMVDSFWGPAALLLLFVLSATIVGALVLGRPIWLYLGGAKKESARLLFYTVGWFGLATAIVFIFLAIK